MNAASLLVFADDWGRHPSSCQHLVGRLLDRYRVCWVNTIGLRPPRLNLATLRRGFEKLRDWRRAPQATGRTNPWVLNPRMWPWCRSRVDRLVNRQLLVRQLAPVILSLPDPVVAVTTIPIVADWIGALPVDRWVYYCVDDFSHWPGLDCVAIQRTEEKLVSLADMVIAVSEPLQQRMAQFGRDAPLLTHGVDLEHWSRGRAEPVPELSGLPRPLVLFWGVIDRRLDVAFIDRLGRDMTRGTIVLLGPDGEPDPAVASCPRVVRAPAVPFERLPDVARDAAVLVMPYADLEVTRAMQPLKLKEYLATGRPAVVRALPATREWHDCLDLAETPESFSTLVRKRIETGLPAAQHFARVRLESEGWDHKARQFESWALGGRAGDSVQDLTETLDLDIEAMREAIAG